MSFDIIEKTCSFIEEGINTLGTEQVFIDFHGGEPTLYPKKEFNRICEHLSEVIGTKAKLSFSLQTNATLIDEAWITLFARHQVGVGVSLDGPKAYNDRFRLSHRGLSTYDATAHGISLLHEAASSKRIVAPAALCVIDPDTDPEIIYQHFVNDLQFRRIDFLLPDYTHDNFDFTTVKKYGQYLCRLFDVWKKDFRHIRVRIIDAFMSHFGEGRPTPYSFTETPSQGCAFVVQSNGDLGPDDTLRTTGLWQTIQPRPNVKHTRLTEYIQHPAVVALDTAAHRIPDDCRQCCWSRVCGGGGLIAHQYSSTDNTSNHPSVYCESLKDFYAHICAYLIDKGYPLERLERKLGIAPQAA